MNTEEQLFAQTEALRMAEEDVLKTFNKCILAGLDKHQNEMYIASEQINAIQIMLGVIEHNSNYYSEIFATAEEHVYVIQFSKKTIQNQINKLFRSN